MTPYASMTIELIPSFVARLTTASASTVRGINNLRRIGKLDVPRGAGGTGDHPATVAGFKALQSRSLRLCRHRELDGGVCSKQAPSRGVANWSMRRGNSAAQSSRPTDFAKPKL